ncbi:hypothetical protein KC19_2G075600 [Ceratodon purpureus]|uniref:Uncharacterized protein n=1 Tax=Ceratodon purpureus TaxID=3225 RepID=A0A8T0IR73_CERPU|nr:hypothetical protein KC19_2G075600 [Ceratodon purpureus]
MPLQRRRMTLPTIPEESEFIVDDSTIMMTMVKRKMDSNMLPAAAQLNGHLLKRCKHIRPDVADMLDQEYEEITLPPTKLHRLSHFKHAKDVTKTLVQKLFPNLRRSEHSDEQHDNTNCHHIRRSIGISLGVRSSLQYLV